MKKAIVITLCLVLVFAAIGCGGTSAPVSAEAVATPVITPAPTAAPTPTPSPSPTPEPLTDVIFDENGAVIRYVGHYTVQGMDLYMFNMRHSFDSLLVVSPGEVTLTGGGNADISPAISLDDKPYFALFPDTDNNLKPVPSGIPSNLMVLAIDRSNDQIAFLENPKQMTVRFTAVAIDGEDSSLSIAFDTGDIDIDFNRIQSTQTLNNERRQKAATDGGYTGLMFSGIDLNGNTIDDSVVSKNKLTVLNFWATWCGPCKKEIPAFSKVAAEYADKGVGFLGVQTDAVLEAAKEIWVSNQVSYPSIFVADDLIELDYAYDSIPVTIILDQNGRQLGDAHVGSMSQKQLTAIIEEALNSWTKEYTFFNSKYDVTMTYAGGDALTFTMTDPDLKDVYTINKSTTHENGLEYVWRVQFTDGNSTFSVGTLHFKFAGSKEKDASISQMMQNSLGYVEGNSTSQIGQAKLQVNGKQLQWIVTIPKKYGFDFENAKVSEIEVYTDGRITAFDK